MIIKENKMWTSQMVMQCCIENNLYDNGSNQEYREMLDMVNCLDPNNLENIYTIAKDISIHTEEETPIESIMFLLNKAICTTYSIT